MNNLEFLTNDALHRFLTELCSEERKLTVQVLDYLVEVERRELYAELGHSSMFSYCMERLRYSESGANRRIRSARAMKRFGEIRPLLLSGDLNLSTLSTAAGVLSDENASELLKRLSGRSKREVEAIVCELQQKPLTVREVIKPVAVKKVVPRSVDTLFSAKTDEKPTNPLRNHQWSEEASEPPPPAVEKRFSLQFSLTEEAMERFRRVQALLSNRLPKGVTLEATVVMLATEFLKRHDPAEREKRRAKRKAPVKPPAKRSRHIEASVRDAVIVRDGGSCSYVSPDGKRCGCTMHLELDHLHPYSAGGTNEASNLRVVCRKHNQLAAEKAFGRAFMERAKGRRGKGPLT